MHLVDFLLTWLANDAWRELVGIDPVSGHTWLLTVDRSPLRRALFLGADGTMLKTAVEKTGTFHLGAYDYRVADGFSRRFLHILESAESSSAAGVEAITVTVQSRASTTHVIGDDPGELVRLLVAEHLPAEFAVERNLSPRDRRDQGRKVGDAAKDRRALRRDSATLQELQSLERTGPNWAAQMLTKHVVGPQFELDELQALGATAAVALLAIWLREKLPARLPDDARARRLCVTILGDLFPALLRCTSLEEARTRLQNMLSRMDRPDRRRAFGSAICDLADYWVWRPLLSRYRLPPTIQIAIGMEGVTGVAAHWDIARRALASRTRARKERSPLPTRVKQLLASLRRCGPTLPERLELRTLGIQRWEFGRWVGEEEGRVLLRMATVAFADLQDVIGESVGALCRAGDLALALGARGHGVSCAHYESDRRVINLTKTRGDGSIAHEFAHFLDHMLAIRAGIEGAGAWSLSAAIKRDHRPAAETHWATAAMRSTLEAISTTDRRLEYMGESRGGRYFHETSVLRAWEDAQHDEQRCFDLLADRDPRRFRNGRRAEALSKLLADSMAHALRRPISVVLTYRGDSDFLSDARKLGPYWARPAEMFARAFESMVEDELVSQGRLSEFLVSQTQGTYDRFRAHPYPRAEERQRINAAIVALLQSVIDHGDSAGPVRESKRPSDAAQGHERKAIGTTKEAVIMDDEYEITHSPLEREVTRENITVRICIYRGREDPGWILEIEDHTGGSTVWKEHFASDRTALDEAMQTIESEGIGSFAAAHER